MGWGWGRGFRRAFPPQATLTLNKVNDHSEEMQVGCGVTTKEIRGRPYLYFWSYENRDGRRVQVFRYLGPARSGAVRDRAGDAIASYYDRAADELRRRRADAIARFASG